MGVARPGLSFNLLRMRHKIAPARKDTPHRLETSTSAGDGPGPDAQRNRAGAVLVASPAHEPACALTHELRHRISKIQQVLRPAGAVVELDVGDIDLQVVV